MPGPNLLHDLACRFTLACSRFIQTALDAANGGQSFFIGGGILDDQFSPAIDREDFRPAGVFKPPQMRFGIALKISKRSDVGQGNHNI